MKHSQHHDVRSMKLGDTGTVEAATQILTGRVEFLEVERVIDLCLEAFAARSVLDVGTGTGLFAEGFAARGLKVAGIDANPAMVEAARRYVSQAEFRQAPAEAIPYPNCAFDLVFLGLVLHEADDRLQALQEARRVARVGVAVLEWPYREGEHGPPLAHRLRPEEVTALAQATGFSQVETLHLRHLVLYRLSIGLGSVGEGRFGCAREV